MIPMRDAQGLATRVGDRATAVAPAAIRAEDEAPLAALINALCLERRNALVVCEDDWLLEALGAQLARRLRKRPELQIELYQPSSTEALLSRFNGMLSDLPLRMAQALPPPHERLRVWVLHLTQARELPDVQLLLRLVQGFPGAGVRLLLLFSQEVAAEQSVASLGPRLHRWVVADAEPAAVDVVEPTSASAALAFASLPSAGAGTAGRAGAAASIDSDEPLGWRDRLQAWSQQAAGLGRACARLPQQGIQRWIMATFALALAVSGSLVAWWHARPGALVSPPPSATRPVPEIVETLETRAALRPSAVNSRAGTP